MSTRPVPRRVLLASQFGFDQLRREIRRGELEQVRRGAYVEPAALRRPSWRWRDARHREYCAAVAASLSTTFAFSHETAAALHRLEAPIRQPVHIVQRFRPCGAMSADIVRHVRPELDESEIVWVRGLPTTSISRTALDCALMSTPPVGLAIADAALRSLAQVDRFHRDASIGRQEIVRRTLLDDLARLGAVRNVRRGRQVLALADGLAESGGESWMRWLALAQGFPAPDLQVPIVTTRGLRFPDAMWSASTGRPVIAEYDGLDKYDDEDSDDAATTVGLKVVEETERQQLLVEATGATFLRFTYLDQRDVMRAARRLLQAFPPGARRAPPPALLARPHRRRR